RSIPLLGEWRSCGARERKLVAWGRIRDLRVEAAVAALRGSPARRIDPDVEHERARCRHGALEGGHELRLALHPEPLGAEGARQHREVDLWDACVRRQTQCGHPL